VARNLLITQGKPAGLSLAPSRHRNASYRRRYVTNRRNINANGVLFSAVVGGSLISKADRPTLAFPNLHSPPKEWVPHVPTLGHGIARICGRSPFLQVCRALPFCTSVLHFCFALFLMHSGARRQPFPAHRFARLHPRQLPHFSLPQNFCVSLCHPYVIRASPVYSEDVPLIGRGRIHRRVCPIIPNS
jgi:hypothetical protein